MQARTYAVGRSSITLRFGDITASKAEVLVSSDDAWLSMGGGVSAALRRAGGTRVLADASKLVPAKVGDVLVTTAGELPARYILHCVTIGERRAEMPAAAIVRQTSRRALEALDVLGCSSIAFPAIGAGVAGIGLQTVAAEMATALVQSLLDAPAPRQVELWLMHRDGSGNPDDLFVFFEQFAARQLGIEASGGAGDTQLKMPERASDGIAPQQAALAQRRHEVSGMLRHLDARRNKLEAELIQVLNADADAARLALLKSQLDQLQALRRSYEAELAPPQPAAEQEVRTGTVFVSSTSADLKPYRQAVRGAVEALGLGFVGMEDFEAAAAAPAELIRRKVRDSEAYVGILGMRYGYVDPGTGLSMTELEYHQAVASAKPMHLFVMDENAPITAGMVETDSVRFARLLEFKGRVMKDHTCKLFTSAQDLADKARETLRMARG
jgi:O-acetyl-ADP-ribose deacetylase (regulator of RNase III)